MASDWQAAVLPANKMPVVKIVVNLNGIKNENFVLTQALVKFVLDKSILYWNKPVT